MPFDKNKDTRDWIHALFLPYPEFAVEEEDTDNTSMDGVDRMATIIATNRHLVYVKGEFILPRVWDDVINECGIKHS